MANKNTKRALLISVLACLLCVSMFVGSTFAWFTDSVSSTGNKIVSGSLKVDLELLEEDGSWTSLKDTEKAIFDYQNWEPGYTELKILKVKNEGTLALKWKAMFTSEKELSELADVIDVYVNPSATQPAQPAGRNLGDYGYVNVGTVADFVNTIEETTYGNLDAGKEAYLGIGLVMQTTAGNEYQGLDLGGAFDISILATQLTAEDDSFGPDYDKDATFPVATADDLKAAFAQGGIFTVAADIALDADETLTVAAGKELVLDLAGHTISGTSDKTGANRNMLDVRGELTVKNGTLTIVHTGANMGWNNSTNVINVTAGGILNLDNAVIKNLGGSDMAFGIHMNNWGEVTLNADNSTIMSTYCAVRVFNSGYDMNNVNITNSKLMAKRAIWVHNYIGDLDAAKHPDADVNARLNFNFLIDNPVDGVPAGDTSNLVAEANNEFVGEIRFGFAITRIYYKNTEAAVVATADAMKTALENGAKEVYVAPGTYDEFPASKLSAGTTLYCEEGTVFEGQASININGATVVGATFSNETGSAARNTVNGTFKDCVFTGSNGLRYCYAGETVVFENCIFDGDVYGAHFDGGANDVVFKNCTFSGFNAFGSAVTLLTLEGCTFVANETSIYNGVNLWGSADLINCTFIFDGSVDYEWVDLCGNNKTVNFTGCVVTDGTTETDIKTIVGDYGTGNTINFN